MATSSFNKHFIVTDKKAIEQFKADEKDPSKSKIINPRMNKDQEELEGIQLLKQKRSASTNY